MSSSVRLFKIFAFEHQNNTTLYIVTVSINIHIHHTVDI